EGDGRGQVADRAREQSRARSAAWPGRQPRSSRGASRPGTRSRRQDARRAARPARGEALTMAERITTARPYAKAIFALARTGNSLAAMSTGLQRAASVVADPQVRQLLGSPHVTPAQLADLVNGISGLDDNGRNFVALLAQNRRLGFLPEIAALFEQMKI